MLGNGLASGIDRQQDCPSPDAKKDGNKQKGVKKDRCVEHPGEPWLRSTWRTAFRPLRSKPAFVSSAYTRRREEPAGRPEEADGDRHAPRRHHGGGRKRREGRAAGEVRSSLRAPSGRGQRHRTRGVRTPSTALDSCLCTLDLELDHKGSNSACMAYTT